MDIKYIETVLEDWKQILSLSSRFSSNFIFRGQNRTKWNLRSTIERITGVKGFGNFLIDYNELMMLSEFKRKYHLYNSDSPENLDNFEWLSIMQHYGAPTRLLDFTKSIFIAAYFATVDASTNSSIWAVNKILLRNNLSKEGYIKKNEERTFDHEINLSHIEFANKIIAKNLGIKSFQPTVIPVEPKKMSERLSRQQGIFLMPTSTSKTFMKNLGYAFLRKNSYFTRMPWDEINNYLPDYYNFDVKKDHPQYDVGVLKINIPNKIRRNILRSLNKMNINAEILFPGLEGLAKSLLQTHGVWI